MTQRIFMLVLALLSLGLGFNAYRQYTARLEAESRLRALTEKMAQAGKAVSARPAAPAQLLTQAGNAAPPVHVPAPDTPERRADVSTRLDAPDAQRLMQLQSRSALDSKYASLFMYLDLPTDKLQMLQGLLQDRQNIFREVIAAMRTQGLAPTPENGPKIQALVNNAAAEIEAQISASLGEADYAKYQRFNAAVLPRVTAERIQQRLSYTAEPLSGSQYVRLMDTLMQDGPAASGATSPADPKLPSAGSAGAPPTITPAIIDQARSFLSAAQLTALQNIQREQAASVELNRKLNAASP